MKFTSKILPPSLREAKILDDLIPWLYLKGISTGATSEGKKELIAIADGYREIEQSRSEPLLETGNRGLTSSPGWPPATVPYASGRRCECVPRLLVATPLGAQNRQRAQQAAQAPAQQGPGHAARHLDAGSSRRSNTLIRGRSGGGGGLGRAGRSLPRGQPQGHRGVGMDHPAAAATRGVVGFPLNQVGRLQDHHHGRGLGLDDAPGWWDQPMELLKCVRLEDVAGENHKGPRGNRATNGSAACSSRH